MTDAVLKAPSQRRGRGFRYSVRTLVVVVTLIAIYFGSWPAFEEQALRDVKETASRNTKAFAIGQFANESSPVPYVLALDEVRILVAGGSVSAEAHRVHYLWLFGYAVRMPYEKPVSIDH